jgi:excisionase family DNA binding protein
MLSNVDLDLEQYEDGQIVFNLHLKQIYSADMLNSKDVCRMLQVSRSFLAKLVRTGQVNSYKIGKLRRFLLEDILEYLGHNARLQEMLGGLSGADDTAHQEEQVGKQRES